MDRGLAGHLAEEQHHPTDALMDDVPPKRAVSVFDIMIASPLEAELDDCVCSFNVRRPVSP